MTRKECFVILQVNEGAGLDDIKRAYRRLAFALHPDLNPDNANAAREFQRLNEAYVLLCDIHQKNEAKAAENDATEKARDQARKAYEKAKGRFEEPKQNGGTRPKQTSSGPAKPEPRTVKEKERDEVLRDLLRDPFARRVFEDIYSQVRHDAAHVRRKGKAVATRSGEAANDAFGAVGRVAGSVKDWVQRQIDDEQTVHLPCTQLVPGARLRLQIRHGFTNKAQTIELTLPPEFQPGRAVRLKGLGKRIGSWRGDLYLKILAK